MMPSLRCSGAARPDRCFAAAKQRLGDRYNELPGPRCATKARPAARAPRAARTGGFARQHADAVANSLPRLPARHRADF